MKKNYHKSMMKFVASKQIVNCFCRKLSQNRSELMKKSGGIFKSYSVFNTFEECELYRKRNCV
jgi:hypothetical protein